MNQRGGGGLLRPSVTQHRCPTSCRWAQRAQAITDREVFVWTLFTRTSNGPQTGKSHESDLIIVFPFVRSAVLILFRTHKL